MLPYTPEQLLAMVGDVDAYPRFIPWITSMRTWNLHTQPDGASTIDSEATVGFSFLRERFSTRARRDPTTNEITVRLLSGPFKRLYNHWRFSPHPDGAAVAFEIDFEFKSALLDGLLRANFHHAVDRLIQCFEDRAAALYARKR